LPGVASADAAQGDEANPMTARRRGPLPVRQRILPGGHGRAGSELLRQAVLPDRHEFLFVGRLDVGWRPAEQVSVPGNQRRR